MDLIYQEGKLLECVKYDQKWILIFYLEEDWGKTEIKSAELGNTEE